MNRDLTKLSKKKMERIRKLCLEYGAKEGQGRHDKIRISVLDNEQLIIPADRAKRNSVFCCSIGRRLACIDSGINGFYMSNSSSSWNFKEVVQYNKEVAECLSFLSEARDIDKRFVR